MKTEVSFDIEGSSWCGCDGCIRTRPQNDLNDLKTLFFNKTRLKTLSTFKTTRQLTTYKSLLYEP